MNIKISLSTESIDAAIRKLTDIHDNLETDVEQLVSILTNEGAMVAQSAYGEWSVIATPISDGTTGEIIVAGDMPLIAEFGAGDGVIPVKFENSPTTPVHAGSYSELHAKQYSRWGFWYFGGNVYSEVPAKHGLLDAKRFINDKAVEIAKEVIQL